ncbi:putative peptidoglycan muropeptide transporter SLC46 [Anticarsia gemmatalis]|uniref:putative peptidoglycan muropeptide transporter SLC46 n=1 Tax=Anticarsia gemmatalis TaxID=129554 RepID=UPI003F775415
MAQDEERLTDSNPTVNTVTISNELPAKPFRITMELPLFLVMAGMSLSGAAINNIVLYRTCVHSLDHSREECKVFLSLEKNNQTELENEVQKYVTTLSTVRSVIEAVVPAILSLFMGVWSDTHGRKPLIVWPLFGITVSSMVLVVYCLMDNLGPWWYVLTVLPYSLCGGFTIFFTGAFCYLSDITTAENRSLRMTIMESAVSVGSIVGSLLSAHVLRLVGNTWLILIATTCNVLAYAFSNICLRESLTGAVNGGITSVLDFLLVKEMVRECFKRRPNNGRAQILLLTLANSLSILILYGMIPLEYMYTREKLHWTLSDYTVFSAVNTSISFFGAFIGIALLQKLIGLSDLLTTNIAFISSLAEYIIRALAITSWHMYLGAGVSLFKGLSSPLIRSFLTKILPVVDIAKVFALMSAIEGLCPLLAPLLYNSLYWYTISIFPGAIYVLSAGIAAICITCLTVVQFYRFNVTTQYQPLESSMRS